MDRFRIVLVNFGFKASMGQRPLQRGVRVPRWRVAVSPLAISFLLLGTSILVGATAHAAALLAEPQYRVENESSVLTLKADGPFTFTKEYQPATQHLILELKGVKLAPGAERRLPTSSFAGVVKMISAYEVSGEEDTVRVTLELAQEVPTQELQDGNQLTVKLPLAKMAESREAAVDSVPGTTPTVSQPPASPQIASPSAAAAGSDLSGSQAIDQFKSSQETRKFVGSPMSLEVRDAELTDVLQLIARYSGFNIVVDEDVRGKLTLSLTDVPWDQVLDTVLRTKQLGGERNGNLLRIARLEAIRKEREDVLQSQKIEQRVIPKKVALFPLNYAALGDMENLIKPFLSVQAAQNQAGSDQGDLPFVNQDVRTNTLIVRDIPEVLQRVKAVIEQIDVPTPQILIEGKVVEASENLSKGISGNLSLFGDGSTQFGVAAAGANVDSLLGTGGEVAFGAASGKASILGFQPDLSIISGFNRLKALLQLEESEGQSKTLASPRVVVRNNVKATITDGTPFLTARVVQTINGGATGQEVGSANLSLTVTPTVANDGNVLLKLNMTRDTPKVLAGDLSGNAQRSIETEVYVESGSTLAIGGIFTSDEEHNEQGFPWLRKIPVLGWFFGGSTDSTNRKELFIFITPRILNPQKLPSELNLEGTGTETLKSSAPGSNSPGPDLDSTPNEDESLDELPPPPPLGGRGNYRRGAWLTGVS